MRIFNPEKALRDLAKTPVILNVILQGVDQARAQSATDGADGWSVLYVLCHINDYEQVFYDRARQMVETDHPYFGPIDHNAWITDNRYDEQKLSDVFATYLSRRKAFLSFLRGLTPEQWERTGETALWGEISVVENATNTTLHDVNHTEQIIKALGLARTLEAP